MSQLLLCPQLHCTCAAFKQGCVYHSGVVLHLQHLQGCCCVFVYLVHRLLARPSFVGTGTVQYGRC